MKIRLMFKYISIKIGLKYVFFFKIKINNVYFDKFKLNLFSIDNY